MEIDRGQNLKEESIVSGNKIQFGSVLVHPSEKLDEEQQ